MKWTALVLMTLMVGSLSADVKEFRVHLPCAVDTDGDKWLDTIHAVRAAKVATPTGSEKRGEKWKTQYFIEVAFKKDPKKWERFELESAGSGDEDYLEYNVKDEKAQEKIGIQGGDIQLKFEWVILSDLEGYSFARCEK